LHYGGVGYAGGLVVGLKALVAAIIGGIGSVNGALIGALLVGGMEALWSSVFPIEFRDPALFVALVLMLWLRPGGLYGTTELPSAPSR
jgi:branched-subunit amino acid ABC-type transport system permease component